MADIKKVYDDLIIINLQMIQVERFWGFQTLCENDFIFVDIKFSWTDIFH